MGATRDPQRTRRVILDAAAAEFSAHGPAGARIDAIADGAGTNKRMLYHYFGNKDGLLAAVLEERLGEPPPDEVSARESESLVERHLHAAERSSETRLLTWEALDHRGPVDADTDARTIAAGEARSRAWRARVAAVEADQRSGRLPARVDAAQLELTLAAIALFPFAFPQLTWLITGQSTTDAAFVEARSVFLEALTGLLGARSATPTKTAETPKARYRLTAMVTESQSRSRAK